MGNRGSKSLGHGFWTKHDVIVAIATACATMATHWVCEEFDAESCGGVKTVVLRGIRGQNRLSIFCPLVHVLPIARCCYLHAKQRPLPLVAAATLKK